jgi:hypothetical protein
VIALTIILKGDGAWPDLAEKIKQGKLVTAQTFEVAALPGGMESGKPSVAVRLDLPDGKVLFAETSLSLFLTAADMFKTRYGDPRDD